MDAVVDLVRLPEVDVVVNALVGAAGLRASYETLRCGQGAGAGEQGKSLVVGGDLIMPLAAQVDQRSAGQAGAGPGRSGPAGGAYAHRLRAWRHLSVPVGRDPSVRCRVCG